MLLAAAADPDVNDTVLQVVGILVGGGIFGALVNLWIGRNKPKVDRGQLQVAEAAQEDAQQGKFRDQILERLAAVERRADEKERAYEQRLDEIEARDRAKGQVIRVLWGDIDELEDHIRLGLGPPPPRGKRHDLQM